MKNKGASPVGDRATGLRPQPAAQSSLSSVPSAGDIGIIEHNFMENTHVVARIEKTGAVMWTVSHWRRGWKDVSDGIWNDPVRRKVREWVPLPANADPQVLSGTLARLRGELVAAERQARDSYYEAVCNLASAMSAQSAETEGLSPKDASAVGDSRDAQQDHPDA